MTRAEHMRWCKGRAREYVNDGDFDSIHDLRSWQAP